MRKGVGGVRLCDQGGCGSRWPCGRHGVLRAGTARRVKVFKYDPLGEKAYVGQTKWCAFECDEAKGDVKCMECGYHECACCDECHGRPCICTAKPECPPLRPGWSPLPKDLNTYRHESGVRVYWDAARCGTGYPWVFRWPSTAFRSEYAFSASLEDAMDVAEAYLAGRRAAARKREMDTLVHGRWSHLDEDVVSAVAGEYYRKWCTE